MIFNFLIQSVIKLVAATLDFIVDIGTIVVNAFCSINPQHPQEVNKEENGTLPINGLF
tara:strand:- start:59 stop:232 length:174 start_codon:yes stop_codon:yes gene_type:complete